MYKKTYIDLGGQGDSPQMKIFGNKNAIKSEFPPRNFGAESPEKFFKNSIFFKWPKAAKHKNY